MSTIIYADYRVHPKQTLEVDASPGGYGFMFDHVDGSDLSFLNSGTVLINSDGGDVVGFTETTYTYGLKDLIWNHSGATLSVTSKLGDATGMDLTDAVATLRNEGVISVVSDERMATGGLIAYGGSFENLGDIEINGSNALGFVLTALDYQHNGGGISAHGPFGATAIQVESNDAAFVNDGKISAVADTGAAIGVQFVYIADLQNTGSITARAFDEGGYENVGVKFAPSSWQESHIENSGVIRAHVAIEAVQGFGDPDDAIIDNSGKLLGDVLLLSANDRISNTGLIRGDIDLGDGRDVYDGSHGRLVGSVDGGAGDDQLLGGKKAEVIIGGAGADILGGGGGADSFIYHRASDSAATHADLIIDLQDSDTIDLSDVDANTTASGDQAFVLVGAFDHHAGEVTLEYDPANDVTYLRADTNGDGAADMVVDIAGDHSSFTNFVL